MPETKLELGYGPMGPNPKQYKFHATGTTELVFGGAKGGGKAEPITAEIPTPSGWTTMGELKPGDYVFGEDGQPVPVLYVTEVMHGHPCYRLTFDDGTEIVCDADHLWKTFTAVDLARLVRRTDEFRERRRANRPSRGTGKRPDLIERNKLNPTQTKPPPTGGIRTTKEIADTIMAPGKQVKKNHAVMLPGALQLPEKDLPIHPYVMGAWLGDGHSAGGLITCSDDEVIGKVGQAGFNYVQRTNGNCGNAKMYRIEGLTTLLRQSGVLNNKHIPMEYLRASREQRLELLKGLMDTDGYARKHGGVEFTATNKVLAENFRELVLSLGWKASVREGRATLNGRYISQKYRIVFTPDEYVFSIPRKIEAQTLASSYVQRAKHRFIISCEPVESVPVKCIKVPGGMYLTSRSMVPTHNTAGLVVEGAAYAAEHPEANIYFFRETYDDLEANIISEWKKRVPPEIYTYHETKHVATMFNGSKIYFRFIRNKADAEKYDGRSIDAIFVDELTKHEEASIQQLLSCLRSPKGYPPRFRGTCNPGGIGHKWVKARYIDPTNKGKKTYKDPVTGNTIAFIQSLVYDNHALMSNDPAYVRRLENLPPKKKAAFLHGDWDQYDGQAFEEFDEKIHVIPEFPIPEHWYRWRSNDPGITDPFSWYWFAVDERGIVYIYREFTREYGDPKLNFTQQAQRVVELSKYLKEVSPGFVQEVMERIGPTYCGHDAFATHPLAQGKTAAWFMQQGGLTSLQSSLPDRKMRKATWHEYLKPIELSSPDPYTGRMTIAKVQIFNTCKKLIETLPLQQEDDKDPEKVLDTSYDHWYDGAGYGLVSFHINKSQYVEAPKPELPFPLRVDEPPEADAVQAYLWS